MKLIACSTDALSSQPIVIMNSDDCLKIGVGPKDRVRISSSGSVVTTLIIIDAMVEKGRILISPVELERCSAKDGDEVEVEFSALPDSIKSIRKKINGMELSRQELDSIINDIMSDNLSEMEILAFVCAFNIKNSTVREIADLAMSMSATGTKVDLGKGPFYDFHSLGGIPGNKITPIVVSIVSSQGLKIPKLSSRAVSSACGTSDYVETFCDVEFGTEGLKRIIDEVGGCFACGNRDYAPVGGKIINAERNMGIDPRPMMIASIMSKKVSLGITHLLIDIPMGKDTKVKDIATARVYAEDLIEVGKILGMHVECAVTAANQPLGTCIGPILEAKECISILEDGMGDDAVVQKACGLAGIIFEMAGFKDGYRMARSALSSGIAHSKFLWIVEAQNGNPNIRSKDLVPGWIYKDVHAKFDGFVQFIDNECMVAIAKGAGAPFDAGAGIELYHKVGDRVSKGDALFRIYAENQSKLDRSVSSARSRRPMRVSEDTVDGIPDKILLETIR